MTFADKLRLTIQWINDVSTGEMIEARDYTRTYLGFPSVSQADLLMLCTLTNLYLAHVHSRWYVQYSMGEIIPLKV